MVSLAHQWRKHYEEEERKHFVSYYVYTKDKEGYIYNCYVQKEKRKASKLGP